MGAIIEWEYPELADYQREWVEDPHPYVAIEGATWTGKTTVFEPWLFEQAHNPTNRGDEYWWMCPTVDQAKAVYDNVKRQLDAAGVLGTSYHSTDNVREIETPRGGILCFKTAEKPDHIFGIRNVRMIVVDEFTRCRITLWPALKSISDKTGAKIRFIGNYKGESSVWHLWVQQMQSSASFKYYRTTALQSVAAGIMPQEKLDEARAMFSTTVFNALYLCQGTDDPSLLVDYGAVADLWTNEHVPEGDKCLIADIALHGSDKFVMGLWSGWRLKEITVMQKRTPKEVEDILKGKATEHGIGRSHIVYDADGLGTYLRSYLQGGTSYQGGTVSLPLVGQKLSYHNLRAQCHFRTADLINSRGMYFETGAYREEIEQELYATLRSGFTDSSGVFHPGENAAGQRTIVPKDHEQGARARLGRSPDLSDMIVMRQFLALTNSPKFVAGLKETAERKRLKFQGSRKVHDGNTYFEGR